MGDHRWRGYAHEELHKMINGGPGVSASATLEDTWKGLSIALEQIDEDIREGLTKVGASWEGSSADAAQNALSPLAKWAEDARQGSDTMKTSAHLQGTYIADARKEMPEPVQVTTEAPSTGDKILGAMTGPFGMMHVIDQQKDHEAQEAAQDNAEQKAITVMNNYESNSTWNRDTLGEFVPPPEVVIDTPPPGGPGSYNESSANYRSPNSADYTPAGDGTTTASGWTPPGSTLPTPPPPPPPIGGDTKTSGWTPPGSTLPNPPVTPPSLPQPKPPMPPQIGFPPPGGGGTFKPTTTNLKPTTGPGGRPVGPGGPGARPGMPTGPGGPGARGGMPTGGMPGGQGGGPNAANAFGRGGATGVGGFGPGAPGAPGGPGAAGGRGGAGVAGGGAAGGRGGEGEEDIEHKTADYLVETDDVFGDERRVAPPVIGEN